MSKVKITFPNGTLDAEMNGTCYIIDSKPTNGIFNNLKKVTVEDGDNFIAEYNNARLIEPYSIDGRYWFSFYELSEEELRYMRLDANITYLAMMSDIQL